MPTERGFVQKIEVGRAGLVSVLLIHTNGSNGTYVIEDLDADPERFNERLSKLAILRDAMNRAEPVEIEHTQGEAGEVIDRVARISRDALGPVSQVLIFTGMVFEAMLHSENGATADGEKYDCAKIFLGSFENGVQNLILNMQGPERQVKVQQFEMIRQAQMHNSLIRVSVDVGNKKTGAQNEIIAVTVLEDLSHYGDQYGEKLNGFVESLSLIRMPGLKENASIFAHVQFTTAPPFEGPGNVIGLTPFTPELIDLLVPKNSLSYELFEAGLRDNLRMRVNAFLTGGRQEDDQADDGEHERLKDIGAEDKDESSQGFRVFLKSYLSSEIEKRRRGVVLGAELLAHLASASRPVWITISRESLDHGPDGFACTTGVPSSDLAPQSLRDLRIPYAAVWRGVGCFNPGVYRFQLQLPTPFRLLVDGKELCLHDATQGEFSYYEGSQKGLSKRNPKIKMAYACLSGEHLIQIEVEGWACNYEFIFDVYQIR
ncbi:MAG: hypothetical protein HUU08_15470 [Candidatus Brocadia sp.]|nr:hypothetical protein [Candidatus Brocadia sp.]